MKLQLKNPIVFFDLETTGTNIVSDRIVEIAYHKVSPNGREETKSIRINPEMHIPEASSAIHGIYDADVADCPTFKSVAKEIARDIEGCDLAGYNSNRFDIPLLAEELLRAEVDIDLMKRKFVDVPALPGGRGKGRKGDCGEARRRFHVQLQGISRAGRMLVV